MADSFIERFLTGTESIPGVSFSAATGVNWTRVASGVVGSFVVAYYTGLVTIIQSVVSGIVDLIEGVGRFISGGFVADTGTPGDLSTVDTLPGLLDVVVNLSEASFAMDMSEYGILGYLAGVASVLGGMYVLSVTSTWITGRYL